MRLLSGYVKPIVALAVTPDGSRLFSAAQGQTMIWEWDLPAARVARKFRCGFDYPVEALVMAATGDFFVSVTSLQGLNYWPLTAGGGATPAQPVAP